MKTTVISNTDNEIDWDKPQVVASQDNRLFLTNGIHNGISFSGTLLSEPRNKQPIGHFSKDWEKCLCIKVTEPVTIKFENE